MNPQDSGPTLPPPSNSLRRENIFVINPPKSTPPPKKSIALIVSITLVAISLFIAVVLFIFMSSAGSAASDYTQLQAAELKKLDTVLEDLEPSAVINQRSLDVSSAKITEAQEARPTLRSIVLIGSWSDQYKRAQGLQSNSQKHYQDVITYIKQLKQLLAFDSSIQAIFDQEPNLSGVLNPQDSLSIRSVGGSYGNFASEIEKLASPPQIKELKKSLVKLYKDKAAAYIAWAVAVEQNNSASATASQQIIEAASGQAAVLTDDQNYIETFSPSYQMLLKQHATLFQRLAG